jgi:hypothetical protein
MRTLLLSLLACLLTSCLSAPREREAHCLAATMMDLWQTEHELTSAEQAWRTAQETSSERSASGAASSPLPLRVTDRNRSGLLVDETILYQRIVSARARHREAMTRNELVARRIQTRIEEDDMLYPVLGMLATSTAIVLYPVVRWNVRSVLWEGADPDAEDDPVQLFCASRLGEVPPALRP